MQVTLKAGLGLTILGMLAGAAVPALAGDGDGPIPTETPIVHLYNTGVDANGQVLANGATGLAGDQHYTLLTVPTGSTTDLRVRTSVGGFPIAPNGPYLGDSSTSAWIGPNGDNQLDGAVGYYDYHTSFYLDPTLLPGFGLKGQWSSDNAGSDIKINGASTGNTIPYGVPGSYSFDHYTSFTISSGFVAGVNDLDFIVHNDGGPTALRVDGLQGGTVAPEPSSFAVFGFLGLGMAGLMLKARKRSTAPATA